MALTLVTLASSSEANCAVVSNGASALMIDAGLPLSKLKVALANASIKPRSIGLIAISHHHGDHAGHAREARLWLSTMRSQGVPLLEPNGTEPGGVTMGTLTLNWTPVPHTDNSRGFVVSCGPLRMGFFHDLGRITPEVQAAVEGLDLLAVEANYDEMMLADCERPQIVKDRIRGPWGHLSNDEVGDLIRRLKNPPKRVVLLHLSEFCNRPELALAACKRKGVRVQVAPAHRAAKYRI